MGFKNNNPKIVSQWIEWAVDELQNNSDLPEIHYIVRALSSSETKYTDRPATHALGGRLAEEFGANFIPEILEKTKITDKFATSGKNAAERRQILEEVYFLNEKYDLNGKNVLVVDDISTSHATFSVIGELIKRKYPKANLYAFFLGQTEKDPNINEGIDNPFT